MPTFKRWIYAWVLKHLTRAVTLDQIISINNAGQIKINGQVISEPELRNLQEECKAFENFRLKTILFTLPKAHAEHKMFTEAKSWDDMLLGKMMLYNVSIQENAILGILTAPPGNQVMAMQQNPYKPK
jgi:hypothetical protein